MLMIMFHQRVIARDLKRPNSKWYRIRNIWSWWIIPSKTLKLWFLGLVLKKYFPIRFVVRTLMCLLIF